MQYNSSSRKMSYHIPVSFKHVLFFFLSTTSFTFCFQGENVKQEGHSQELIDHLHDKVLI